jgi:hypothetical protein
MSLGRAVGTVGLAFALAFAVLSWQSRESAAPAEVAEPVAPSAMRAATAAAAVAAVAAPVRARGAAPGLTAEPFAGREMAITSDGPETAVVALRSSALSGRALSIELGTREPPADGKRVFATVSVSDALGNTVMDCSWRDVELDGDARKLDCEVPESVELPLTISGHQRSAPSFVETPSVATVDPEVRP